MEAQLERNTTFPEMRFFTVAQKDVGFCGGRPAGFHHRGRTRGPDGTITLLANGGVVVPDRGASRHDGPATTGHPAGGFLCRRLKVTPPPSVLDGTEQERSADRVRGGLLRQHLVRVFQ
jgi:hypothetical protein